MWNRLLFLACAAVAACSPSERDDTPSFEVGGIVFQDSFDRADTASWIVESETAVDLKDCVVNGELILDVPAGITVWNTTRYEGNVLFEFDVTVVQAGGNNDRVSDLNCFWMAGDPAFPDKFFERSAWRGGKFWNYYTLNLYYVGYGGHNNTKTRMRRYDVAVPPPPPIVKEYDDPSHLIRPNKKNTIRILCFESRVIYFFNGEKLFDLTDTKPYKEGYFGFRTTHNHMRVDHFKVFSLSPKAASL